MSNFQAQYQITDKITLRHPTVGDVVSGYGEKKYFTIVRILTDIPSDAKSVLFDAGIDWEEISDFEFFTLTAKSLPVDEFKVFFPELDISKFNVYRREDGELIFADLESNAIIDRYSHSKIAKILCDLHRIVKKPERAGNELTKRIMIDEDRMARARYRDKEYKSTMWPLVSSMVNSAGFKYDYNSVNTMLLGHFMDAVSRTQLINATNHLLSGVYHGTIDTKKMKKDRLDWMRPI